MEGGRHESVGKYAGVMLDGEWGERAGGGGELDFAKLEAGLGAVQRQTGWLPLAGSLQSWPE